MKTLTSTAKKLQTVFRVFNVLFDIAVVCCIIGLEIIAAYYIFDLSVEQIGTGFNHLDVGDFLELHVMENYAPSIDIILIQTSVGLLLAIVCIVVGKLCVKCIFDMLQPISEGKPFTAVVGESLRKMAVYSIILGVAVNVLNVTNQAFLIFGCNLPELLTSEKISHVEFNFEFEAGFLVVTAVLILLSYIFKYGEELQIQSDETL